MVTATEFDAFWGLYPRKIGKLAALKAYERARKLDTAEHILAGVHGYLRHLPDDLQFVCHAATWLNQGRWMDEHEVAAPVKEYWADECARVHGSSCTKRWQHDTLMRESA